MVKAMIEVSCAQRQEACKQW